MDKYIEIFCEQNPKFSLNCGNPKCKKEHTFKSKDIFKKKSFNFECSSCGNVTEIDSSKVAKDIVTQLKKFNISIK